MIIVQRPMIITYSGHLIDKLEDFDMSDVRIEDIAHQLSLECRYNGAVPYLYSVAQHLCLCGSIAPPELALYALTHDIHEYILKDIPSYLKLELGHVYMRLEQRIQCIMEIALNIPHPDASQRASVKHIDEMMLSTELRDLFRSRGFEYYGRQPEVNAIRIKYMEPSIVEKMFLDMFNNLIKDDNAL